MRGGGGWGRLARGKRSERELGQSLPPLRQPPHHTKSHAGAVLMTYYDDSSHFEGGLGLGNSEFSVFQLLTRGSRFWDSFL